MLETYEAFEAENARAPNLKLRQNCNFAAASLVATILRIDKWLLVREDFAVRDVLRLDALAREARAFHRRGASIPSGITTEAAEIAGCYRGTLSAEPTTSNLAIRFFRHWQPIGEHADFQAVTLSGEGKKPDSHLSLAVAAILARSEVGRHLSDEIVAEDAIEFAHLISAAKKLKERRLSTYRLDVARKCDAAREIAKRYGVELIDCDKTVELFGLAAFAFMWPRNGHIDYRFPRLQRLI